MGRFFLSMTQIPSDDILEGLYILRIRESEKLKTVLELYNMEIHQKKLGTDYHRLKTMVKRSIEQEIRNKNFGNRYGNFEKKRRGQESGNKTACVGNGKLTGSVVKETIAVSDTIRISEQNRQSRTLLQDLLRSTV